MAFFPPQYGQKKQYTPQELEYLMNGYAVEKQQNPTATPNIQSAQSISTPPIPQTVPTPSQVTPTPIPRQPDIVSPFTHPETTEVTQGLGENAWNPQYNYGAQGHEGVDMTNPNLNVTNPIGGINVTGYSPPKGYGNWQVIAGANPQELAQMEPQTEQEIRDTITQYMLSNPSDIRGLQIPGKNISIQSHLADPAPADATIATGSANLTMGGSGGWSPHLHSALKNTNDEMVNILNEIQRRARGR